MMNHRIVTIRQKTEKYLRRNIREYWLQTPKEDSNSAIMLPCIERTVVNILLGYGYVCVKKYRNRQIEKAKRMIYNSTRNNIWTMCIEEVERGRFDGDAGFA